MLTLARAARAVGGRLGIENLVEAALDQYGARAEQPLDQETREARALLVSQFVRYLKLGVAKMHDIERVLLTELHAAPDGMQVVVIRDAISVIKARNHIGQIAKALGLGWADGMRLESALSDFVRYAAANAGGLLCTTVSGNTTKIELKLQLRDSPPDLSLLSGLDLATPVSTRREGTELSIELELNAPARSGAA